MMAMVPNTIDMAKMCTTSSAGKAQVDSAIHSDRRIAERIQVIEELLHVVLPSAGVCPLRRQCTTV
jgi:hypothetical protein